MIENKDYILKEIKKAIHILAKLMGYQNANQFEKIASFNDEQLDYNNLNKLLNEKEKLNQNEYALAKSILQANYIKLKAYHHLNDKKSFNTELNLWLNTLENCTTKSGNYDFELMDLKEQLISEQSNYFTK